MVVAYYGADASSKAVAESAYDRALGGTLITDLADAARRAGFDAEVATLDDSAVIALIRQGIPPILLYQNGTGPVTARHFGVVVGWDPAGDAFVLHDGGARSRRSHRPLEDRGVPGADRPQARAMRRGATSPAASTARGFALALVAALSAGGCSHLVLLHDPLTAPEHNDLGVAYESRGELDHAAGEYRAALRLDRHCERARVNLGNIEASRGRWKRAERCFRAALLDSAADADALNNLAVVLVRQRKSAEARALAERAVRIGGARDSIYRATLDEARASP